MCGRFTQICALESLLSEFEADPSALIEVNPNYNIAPSQEVLAVIREQNTNKLVRLRWGLVPFWAKDLSIGSRLINARLETVAHKPSFKSAFKRRRCLIIADGFFEWKGAKGHKQPMYIQLANKTVFAFAGLWERWQQGSNIYQSCTIITTVAQGILAEIHHRMPVILAQKCYQAWLDPTNQDTEQLMRLLHTGQRHDLIAYPVSTYVNKASHNDIQCTRPFQDSAQKTLNT
jgi:putative SOS response-associated peptidase YedK